MQSTGFRLFLFTLLLTPILASTSYSQPKDPAPWPSSVRSVASQLSQLIEANADITTITDSNYNQVQQKLVNDVNFLETTLSNAQIDWSTIPQVTSDTQSAITVADAAAIDIRMLIDLAIKNKIKLDTILDDSGQNYVLTGINNDLLESNELLAAAGADDSKISDTAPESTTPIGYQPPTTPDTPPETTTDPSSSTPPVPTQNQPTPTQPSDPSPRLSAAATQMMSYSDENIYKIATHNNQPRARNMFNNCYLLVTEADNECGGFRLEFKDQVRAHECYNTKEEAIAGLRLAIQNNSCGI